MPDYQISTYKSLPSGDVGVVTPEPVPGEGGALLNQNAKVLCDAVEAAFTAIADFEATPGPQGPQGDKGDKGDPGNDGATGATGAVGPKGDKGDTGATGADGQDGSQGVQGPPGATGPQGTAGATGPTGPQGVKGDQGDQGDEGPAGATGATGATGPAGPKGDQGDQGPPGATGPQGTTGTAGATGPTGPTGATGPAGPVMSIPALQVLAGPTSGAAATGSPRSLVAADIPALPESAITNLSTDLAAKAPATRAINTTAPLTGGGDLSANRTIAIPKATASVDGYLAAADFATFAAGGGGGAGVYYTNSGTVANGATLSVSHPSDPSPRKRLVTAYAPATGPNAVPQMTTNTAPSGTASASDIYGAGYEAYRAFDQTTSAGGWASTSSAPPHWLQYQFPSGTVVIAYALTVVNTISGQEPKSWTFAGSNDGSTWTTLDTQTNVAAWTASLRRVYQIGNSTSYTYYRLNVTAAQSGNIAQLDQLELLPGSGSDVELPLGTPTGVGVSMTDTSTVFTNNTGSGTMMTGVVEIGAIATVATMVSSGASHAAGLAPDPGATAGSTKFLREDATWAVPAGGSTANYFGDGSDGAVTVSASANWETSTSADDTGVVIKNFTSLTINSGQTVTANHRAKAMLLYCTGNVTINGTLHMNGKGAAATAATDTTIVRTMVNAGLFANETAAGTRFFSVPAAGGAGGLGGKTGNPTLGSPGTAGANGGTGGGGGGAGGAGGGGQFGLGGNGAAGTAFCGGAGGGAGGFDGSSGTNGVNGAVNGGAGGNGGSCGTSYGAGGGAGNPGGTGRVQGANGGTGAGGTLILVVKGTLTIGASGVVSANGSAGGNSTSNGLGGGGSGGGSVVVLYGGTYSNSGTVQANGGAGGTSSPSTTNPGGAGGAGSVQLAQISTT